MMDFVTPDSNLSDVFDCQQHVQDLHNELPIIWGSSFGH